jgi:hypothetical protein
MKSEREDGLEARTRGLEWIVVERGEAELLYVFVCFACAGRKGDVWSDYGLDVCYETSTKQAPRLARRLRYERQNGRREVRRQVPYLNSTSNNKAPTPLLFLSLYARWVCLCSFHSGPLSSLPVCITGHPTIDFSFSCPSGPARVFSSNKADPPRKDQIKELKGDRDGAAEPAARFHMLALWPALGPGWVRDSLALFWLRRRLKPGPQPQPR